MKNAKKEKYYCTLYDIIAKCKWYSNNPKSCNNCAYKIKVNNRGK